MTTGPAAAAGVALAPASQVAVPAPEVAARDAVIGWFRGEFAAANAVIDGLCGHLAQIGGAAEYDAVFSALHRRRLNWFPVLHMQKFYSVADVAAELRRVADARASAAYSEEEAASTVIHEPMDEHLVALAAGPESEPEHVHDPTPQDPAPEAEPNGAVNPVSPTSAAASAAGDHEVADGEDSFGDSSEHKTASTEDDGVADAPARLVPLNAELFFLVDVDRTAGSAPPGQSRPTVPAAAAAAAAKALVWSYISLRLHAAARLGQTGTLLAWSPCIGKYPTNWYGRSRQIYRWLALLVKASLASAKRAAPGAVVWRAEGRGRPPAAAVN
ncbi:hypothetical protein GUJ93_ZPchr0010g8420 [Zizania palustris]|uniref:Uncharacterized protein n=1 Tax=Zizania palustris TaxID=103762 RepID=A0A8J5W8V9_ZIZPA|nr:hypothetical protein GUJ93_ZPchr0010g8420 [Zizania palustris]